MLLVNVILTPLPSHPNEFVSSPKGTNRIGWHLIVLRARRQRSVWIAKVRISCDDAARTQDIQLVRPLSSKICGIKLGVVFLADCATRFRVRLYNASDVPEAVGLTLLSDPALPSRHRKLPAEPCSLPRRVSERVRVLGRHGFGRGSLPPPSKASTSSLITLCGRGFSTPGARRACGGSRTRCPPSQLSACWCSAARGNEAPLAATLASVHAQTYAPTAVMVASPGEAGGELGVGISEYVAILQAGEVLPRHALLLLVHELGLQETDALLADEDNIGPDGTRADPWFKPQPSLTMMCSGLLSRGVWLVRSSVLQQALASVAVPGWAECIRLAVWFTLHAAGEGGAGPPRAARVDPSSGRCGGRALRRVGAGDQYVPGPPRGPGDGSAGVPAAAALVRGRAGDPQGKPDRPIPVARRRPIALSAGRAGEHHLSQLRNASRRDAGRPPGRGAASSGRAPPRRGPGAGRAAAAAVVQLLAGQQLRA